MRAVLQRVTEAAVHVDGEVVGQIGPGLMILICAMPGDTPEVSAALAAKISKLRIFKDELGNDDPVPHSVPHPEGPTVPAVCLSAL